MMELKEFVKETLRSLQEASSELSDEGIYVNPPTAVRNKQDSVRVDGQNAPVTVVSFDVAVTETVADKAGAKAGIAILPIAAQASGEVSSATNNASRISFEIRVLLLGNKVEADFGATTSVEGSW
ncbi:hypothetical protein BMI89_18015 [Thioclava sp. F36-7]|nr:hypothetical protein BMI89_18015 [Thioclava sp. F36-7]